MRSSYAEFCLFIAAFLVPAGPAVSAPPRCHVVGNDKLMAELGGASALCATVEKAIAAAAPNAHYEAELRVVSTSRMSAALTVNGRALPEQKLAVMDRRLNAEVIQRFADALAAEVAKAARH